jgi:glycosyltransferase involved in cell wall biosynthesis
MKISYYTIKAGLNPAVGFGYAGKNIVKSLNNLGYEVSFANPKSDIQLNFTQPHHFKLHRNQYQIGYTPWESTSMRTDWVDKFNFCDEVWATSDWVAKVFKDNGVTKPIYVYPHGVEDIWKPKKRVLKENEPFKFLHVGEPSPRKDGQLVVDTFIKLFGNNPDYHLTIKAHGFSTIRVYDKNREFVNPDKAYNNITVITEEYSEPDLVSLFHRHHALIYPSWGEGLGFIPIQGLATGMPVISTYDWAHYEKYIGPLKLKSQLTSDTLPKAVGDPHVGKMFRPDKQHLEDLMYDVVINSKAYFGYYFAQSKKIHEEYNWDQLTKNAFERLSKKFS